MHPRGEEHNIPGEKITARGAKRPGDAVVGGGAGRETLIRWFSQCCLMSKPAHMTCDQI